MCWNLPNSPSDSSSRVEPGQPDSEYRSWTDGDTVAHEHQAGASPSPGRGHRKRDLRNELRGPEVREAIMAGVLVAVTIALFLGGVVVGIIAVVAFSVHREDRAYTLLGDAPGRMSKSARRLNGVGRRDLDAIPVPSARELVH